MIAGDKRLLAPAVISAVGWWLFGSPRPTASSRFRLCEPSGGPRLGSLA